MTNYKSHVGPSDVYESTGKQVFNLLLNHGLLPQHRLLDIGCGGLRIGTHIIPYLDTGNYHGVEPDTRVLYEAVNAELPLPLQLLKKPEFSHSAEFKVPSFQPFDFVLAFDVFYHCGKEQFRQFLTNIKNIIDPKTKIYISVMFADGNSHQTKEGVYHYQHASHSNVYFTIEEFTQVTKDFGFSCRHINLHEGLFFGSRLIFEVKEEIKLL